MSWLFLIKYVFVDQRFPTFFLLTIKIRKHAHPLRTFENLIQFCLWIFVNKTTKYDKWLHKSYRPEHVYDIPRNILLINSTKNANIDKSKIVNSLKM